MELNSIRKTAETMELQLKYDPLERSGEIEIHAWLLIWSWGFLIPCGTLVWTHTKRHEPVHPYLHFFGSGIVGVVLAIAGFAFGIKRFSTFSRPNVSTFRMAHAVIGTIATIGMMLQVLLYAVMKFKWPLWRKIGLHSHCYFGWLWLAFGLVACETGTHITSVTDPQYKHFGLDHENEKYAGGFIGALLATALVTVSMVTWHNKSVGGVAPVPGEKSPENEKVDVEAPPAAAFIELPSASALEKAESME